LTFRRGNPIKHKLVDTTLNGRRERLRSSHMMKNRISLNLPLPSSHCDHHAAQDTCSLMLAHAGAVSTRGRAL
jgi:hypothetical protein